MKFVLHVPDRIEYPLEMSQSPERLKPGDSVALTFRVLDPVTGRPVKRFELVHEKLMHLFVVSENLQFFEHVHPQLQSDGSFRLSTRLPNGGMYRLLADYYPSGSVPQLTIETLYVSGLVRRQSCSLPATVAIGKFGGVAASRPRTAARRF